MQQEAAVTGFAGDNRWRILLTLGCIGFAPIVHHVFLQFVFDVVPLFKRIYDRNWFIKVNIDMIVMYGYAASLFIYGDDIDSIVMGTLVLMATIHILSGLLNKPLMVNIFARQNPNSAMELKLTDSGEIISLRVHMITTVKAVCNILTCIAIMAVDFPPLCNRKLTKTEESGWSMMDVGVSSLIILGALGSKVCI